jgi:alpha-glucosidase
VAEIAASERQDPTFFRSEGEDWGRDGCRVPLPWASGESFGFGSNGSHLPQPAWFEEYSVAREEADPGSTLHLYRRALQMRRELQTEERLEWINTGRADVLHFRRPNGWEVVTNFGSEAYALPPGRGEQDGTEVLIASSPLENGAIGADTTVWLRAAQ